MERKIKIKYRCSEDCKQEGCPSHEAEAIFQTSTNAFFFDNGRGDIYYFEQNELEAFKELLRQLGLTK